MPINTRVVISYAMKQSIPFWVSEEVNENWDNNLIRTSNWGKAIVEQILASEEINKSKRARLWESQSGIRIGKLTIWVRSFEIEKLVLKKIYKSNIYWKNLSWPHFDEARVQENQQGKDQQSCIFVFVAFLTVPSINYGQQPRHDNNIPYMGVVNLQRYREASGERNFTERIKVPIFLEAVLAIEIM